MWIKNLILIYLLLLGSISSNAQSIKNQSNKQKQQQRQNQANQQKQKQYEQQKKDNELKEQIRIKKAQLDLNDLLLLLKSKDLEYVDNYLTLRGWELHSTNIEEEEKDEEDEETVFYERKAIKYSFDKEFYDSDLASGWFTFYLYTNYDNAILYCIAKENQLAVLKTQLANSGFNRLYPTDIIERGLESVYRNNLYEVTIQKRLKMEYEKGADIGYNFYIYNYKQIEERKAEVARIAAEQQAEIERLLREAAQAEIDIDVLLQDAEKFIDEKQYEKAKGKYTDALVIKPNKKIDFINTKLKEIKESQKLITERSYKIYDYKTLERIDYDEKNNYIESGLKNNLATNNKNIPKMVITIVYKVDTFGVTKINYTTSVQNEDINIILNKLTSNLNLKACFINNYTAMAKAEFSYTIEHNHSVVAAIKTPTNITSKNKNFNLYRSTINNKLYSAPSGKYTFDLKKTIINGAEYSNNKLVKTSNQGGAANMFLSLLVPGLGDHRVTYGKRKGIGVALSTYGLIGAGIGLKFYSISEYKKYHAATKHSAMYKYYNNANYSNYAFYSCIGAAAIIWLSDIIWVASKGAKNTKAQKVFNRNNLSFYNDPTFNTNGLTYTLKF